MTAVPTLAFVAALYDEVSIAVRTRRHGYERVFAPGGALAYVTTAGAAGQPTTIVATGWGAAAAEAGTKWLVSEMRPSVIVATGYAGGTLPGHAAGTLAIAETVVAGGGGPDAADRVGAEPVPSQLSGHVACDRSLVHLAHSSAQQLRVPFATGLLATTPRIVCAAAQKRALGETSGAIAVDLETWHIGRVAADAGVPFLAVRAIVDTVDDDLPGFVEQLAPGPRPPAALPALRYLARRPASLPSIIRTGRAAGRARRTIAAFIAEFGDRWGAAVADSSHGAALK
jgi:adenosylhomocysteine nucleosidase